MAASSFGDASATGPALRELYRRYGLDPRGDNELGAAFNRFGAYLFGPAASRLTASAAQEGQYQRILQELVDRMQNRNGEVRGQRAAERTNAAFASAQDRADQALRARGLGEGARAGTLRGLSSAAARSAATASMTETDPRRRDADLEQATQLLTGSIGSNPYLEQMLALFAPVEQRQQANAQAKAGRGFGGAAGGLLGGLLGSGAFERVLGGKGGLR